MRALWFFYNWQGLFFSLNDIQERTTRSFVDLFAAARRWLNLHAYLFASLYVVHCNYRAVVRALFGEGDARRVNIY